MPDMLVPTARNSAEQSLRVLGSPCVMVGDALNFVFVFL